MENTENLVAAAGFLFWLGVIFGILYLIFPLVVMAQLSRTNWHLKRIWKELTKQGKEASKDEPPAPFE